MLNLPTALPTALIAQVSRLLGDRDGDHADGRFLFLRGAMDFSARIAGVALVLVWTLILVRLLGPEDYGRYVYVLSITFFVSLVGGLGLPTVSSYYVARYRRTARRTRLRAFLLLATGVTIVGPLLGTVAIWLWVTLAGGTAFQPFDLAAVLAFSVGAALVQLYTLTNRALERTTVAAYGEQVLQRVLAFACIGVPVYLGVTATPNLALYGNVIGALGAAAVMATAAFRRVGRGAITTVAARRCVSLSPRWMRRAVTMMVTPVFFLVLSETDILMLGAFATPAAVGIYHVARRISGFMTFFYTAVVAVGLHRFVGAHMEQDVARLRTLVRGMGLLGLIPAVGLWLVFLLFGPWLLGIFGPEMAAGYTVLMIIATTFLLEMAMGPATELLMMTGHERPVSRINMVFAVVNVGLNAALVPPFGMEGAAVASALAILPWKVTLMVVAWRTLGVATVAFPLPASWTQPAASRP
ncbi:oligosaccharide flippase family protein [Roseospira visakhapatnamensis]|uniref:O-antigen/teichoic acid export membrane protein n=1 Tax=Roseospira visakhapatnamensis TaxID=390880 RepID=A0A7W6RF36_9PROT|nr:oligosaccharide flippase family protein [Roseospira visakhapatnamensis]MBB4267384.1 O-antigen/teichoic acid export membrane protein [Roseospira visakhapatnamensis]